MHLISIEPCWIWKLMNLWGAINERWKTNKARRETNKGSWSIEGLSKALNRHKMLNLARTSATSFLVGCGGVFQQETFGRLWSKSWIVFGADLILELLSILDLGSSSQVLGLWEEIRIADGDFPIPLDDTSLMEPVKLVLRGFEKYFSPFRLPCFLSTGALRFFTEWRADAKSFPVRFVVYFPIWALSGPRRAKTPLGTHSGITSNWNSAKTNFQYWIFSL